MQGVNRTNEIHGLCTNFLHSYLHSQWSPPEGLVNNWSRQPVHEHPQVFICITQKCSERWKVGRSTYSPFPVAAPLQYLKLLHVDHVAPHKHAKQGLATVASQNSRGPTQPQRIHNFLKQALSIPSSTY
jgi:hypothetical protein